MKKVLHNSHVFVANFVSVSSELCNTKSAFFPQYFFTFAGINKTFKGLRKGQTLNQKVK